MTMVVARSIQSQKYRVSRKWGGTIEEIDPLPPTKLHYLEVPQPSPKVPPTGDSVQTHDPMCVCGGGHFIFNTLKHRPAAVSPVFKHCRQDKMTKRLIKDEVFPNVTVFA